jgi:DNA-binding NarL/FixJ family response regulator
MMPTPSAPSGHTTPSLRVLLVEDHAIVRAGVRLLLESEPGLIVVGEAATITEALVLTTREQPALILLDLDLGGELVAACIPALLEAAPAARLVVLTGVRDPEAHRQAVRHGAMGLVLKDHTVDTLFQALAHVHRGEVWLEPALAAQVLRELTHPRPAPPPSPEAAAIAQLTAREREVITLIAAGLRNQPIAARLGISEATVRHHLTAIFAKLGVSDRVALMLYAYQHGLATPPGSWGER